MFFPILRTARTTPEAGGFPLETGLYFFSFLTPSHKFPTTTRWRDKWAAPLYSYLKMGPITHHRLEKLIGLLSFPKAELLGKFAMAHLRPLY